MYFCIKFKDLGYSNTEFSEENYIVLLCICLTSPNTTISTKDTKL